VILDNNLKINLEKSIIDNLNDNSDNNNTLNKSQDNIPQQQITTLGIRSSIVTNKINHQNKKLKSIYLSVNNNYVKLNVSGTEGKHIYEKMNDYLNKFQKNHDVNETKSTNKKSLIGKNSINSKSPTNPEKVSNINNKSKKKFIN